MLLGSVACNEFRLISISSLFPDACVISKSVSFYPNLGLFSKRSPPSLACCVLRHGARHSGEIWSYLHAAKGDALPREHKAPTGKVEWMSGNSWWLSCLRTKFLRTIHEQADEKENILIGKIQTIMSKRASIACRQSLSLSYLCGFFKLKLSVSCMQMNHTNNQPAA